MLPLAECRMQTVKCRRLYLYDMQPSVVARIILGWNMSPACVAAVPNYVSSLNPKVDISSRLASLADA